MKRITTFLVIVLFAQTCYASAKNPPMPKPDDFSYQHCNYFINIFSTIELWRQHNAPIENVNKRILEAITGSPFETPSTPEQSAAWNNAIASDADSLAAWKNVTLKLYNSTATMQQIDGAMRKYCTPYTKHIFTPNDLDPLLSKLVPDHTREDRSKYCVMVGNAYSYAASTRDQGIAPEQSLSILHATYLNILDDKHLKKIINDVYFNPDFAYAGGTALTVQMMNICTGHYENWKPLK